MDTPDWQNVSNYQIESTDNHTRLLCSETKIVLWRLMTSVRRKINSCCVQSFSLAQANFVGVVSPLTYGWLWCHNCSGPLLASLLIIDPYSWDDHMQIAKRGCFRLARDHVRDGVGSNEKAHAGKKSSKSCNQEGGTYQWQWVTVMLSFINLQTSLFIKPTWLFLC